jgi:Tfp pilus assembly protein PilN
MIEINLLPEELRNRVVKAAKPEVIKSGSKLNPQLMILLVPLFFILLILAHIYFIVLGVSRSSQLGFLKARWEKIAPERKTLDDFNAENSLISGDTQVIRKLTNERITWADKLNKLSFVLPPGVWFQSISVTNKDFSLMGSVVSPKREEITLLRQLIDNLKNDHDFFKDFSSLELGSIQKMSIQGYEVTDFTLIGTFKGK